MYRTLILNRSYRPHEVVSWENAITRMFSGKVEVLVQYEDILTTLTNAKLRDFPDLRKALRQVLGVDAESIDIKVPAVAVLLGRVSRTKSGVKFSKINVAQRDNFCCQYCGQRFPLSQLTYDHVLPRSQGGKTVWDNIVMSCGPCNSRKANRTPEESGMTPLHKPVRPDILPMAEPCINVQDAPDEWLPFIEGVPRAS
jgi:5-methylcytosine-specific restriction endonuclease McrA